MKLMHSLTRSCLLILSLLLGLGASLAQADPVVAGYVTRLRGEVSLQAAAGTQVLALGSPLLLGGRISTGADARLEARMKDGSLLTLGERTEFLIEQVAGSSPAANDSRFSLLKGVFRAITGSLADGRKAASWQVHTSVAIIGVRGTDLWGGLNLLGSGANTLDVVMFEGKGVDVQNKLGTTQLRVGGEGTTVSGNAVAPIPPTSWSEQKLQAAQRSVSW